MRRLQDERRDLHVGINRFALWAHNRKRVDEAEVSSGAPALLCCLALHGPRHCWWRLAPAGCALL